MIKIKSNLLKLTALLITFSLLGLGCKGSGEVAPEELKPVTLNYWSVFNEPSDLSEMLTAWRARYPHITINLRKVRIEDYEETMLRSLAEGKGPDIVSLHNTWLRQYQDALAPLPAAITLPVTQIEGRKKRVVLETQPALTLRDLRNNYVDVVVADAVMDSQIYGLPLSLDTLILYYNRTLLNQANIPTPPASWLEFKEAVKALTLQDKNGNIAQAGAALGTSRNINRAPDILAVLLMQNGTEMTDSAGTQATFNRIPAGLSNREVNPGREALTFYTDFASPAKEVYTWNEKMPESLNAFTSQKSAFFFGYSYHLPLIRSLAPALDLGIAKLPQISSGARPVNFANYWLEVVAKQSAHPNEAWAFVQFATAADQVKIFLQKARRPTALRTLISDQRQDDILVNFADEVLTAQSWYRGKNPKAAEEAMRVMIDQVGRGEATVEEAINKAVEKVNETF